MQARPAVPPLLNRLNLTLAVTLLLAGLLWPGQAADRLPQPEPAAAWHEAACTILTDVAGIKPVTGPWLAVGPFSRDDFQFPFPPEGATERPRAGRGYRSRSGRQLAWRPVQIPDGKDFDLRGLCPGYRGDGTFYLFRTLQVPRAGMHAVAMRGASGLAVWLNGEQLLDRGPGDGWLGGGWEPKEAVLLPLAKGENQLLIRLDGLDKNATWMFRYGQPEPAALRYTLSMTLRRQYTQAAVGLQWLRRDGLDLLEVCSGASGQAESRGRLKGAVELALRRGSAWLALLRAARVAETQLRRPAETLDQVRRQLHSDAPLAHLYFKANEACQQIKNLPQAQVIQNWLELDERSVLSPMDHTLRAPIAAALKRARRLLADYGARLRAPADLRGQLAALQARLDSLTDEAAPAAWRQLYLDAHATVRRLVFQNPLLSFRELVFYKRHTPRTMNIHRHQFPSARYMDWPAQPGGDLCVLTDLRPDGLVRPLLHGRLGRGIIRGFDLSYDARRIVFAFWNADVKNPYPKRRFEYDCYAIEGHAHLYELDLQTDTISQLTNAPWHDIDPCYLPNGRVAFASERCSHNAQCDPNPWSEPMVNLYTVSRHGKHLRRLTSHKDSDNFPRVLNDGRLCYTRWEYHERGGLLHTQTLWVSRPDGSQEGALFKEHLDLPFSLEEARAVPGTSKLVAVATGHHTNAAGPIVLIDLAQGIRSAEAMLLVTPGYSIFEGGIDCDPVPEGGVGGYGYYSSPWPLSDKYFLVAYNPGCDATRAAKTAKGIPWGSYLSGVPPVDMSRAAGFGLYVIDVFGNRELIYRDPYISCFNPVPLRARPRPPVLPDRTDPAADHATLVVTDVHQGLGVPAGTVKYLRVSEALPWPYTKEGAQRYPREFDYTMKRTIGLVPVEPDGSAHFTVPAGVGLYFQALDKDLIEVRRMRSLVSFQPGERRACTGCHQTQSRSPELAGLAATARPPSQPQPPPWGTERPISFLRDVQPILDRHCVRCHSGLKPAGNVDLLPGLTGPARDRAHCISFDALSRYVPRSHVPFRDRSRPPIFDVTQPYQFGSAKSELVRLLKAGHEGVKLNRDEWLTLLTWIDYNGLYLGSFVSVHDWGRWGYRPQPTDMAAIRALQGRRCAACHGGQDLARPGWIDPRRPEASLFLVAPLAKAAGGWGRCQPTVFNTTADPDYQRLLQQTRRIFSRMRRDPTPGMKELIAAERLRNQRPAADAPSASAPSPAFSASRRSTGSE